MGALEAIGRRVHEELTRTFGEREPDAIRRPAARPGVEPATAVFGHTADRHERRQAPGPSGGDGSNPVEAAAVGAVRRLNSDGDRVVVSLTGEGKVVVPWRVPVGGKAQYGYDVTIQQAGDAATPGADDAQTRYQVTFGKNLLAGALAETPSASVGAGYEVNLRSADQVTMTFETREEALRAVGILQRVAMAETARDAGSAAPLPGGAPSLDNPAANPLPEGNGSGLPANPLAPGEVAARALEPSRADREFLTGHVTGYTTVLGPQDRLKFSAEIGNLGIEQRFDANREITRTVELPQGNEPGRITYTISGELEGSTKEKLKTGLGPYSAQNIVENGRLRAEVSLGYDLQPDQLGPTSGSGKPVPEPGLIAEGRLGRPDEIAVNISGERMDQSLVDLSRTDLKRVEFDARLAEPRDNARPVLERLFEGDLRGAVTAGNGALTISRTTEDVTRTGIHQQHELGFGARGAEAKVSLIAEIGTDDVRNRTTVQLDGTPTDPTQPPEPGQETGQLVVVPRDGLNVRAEPTAAAERAGVLRHGTFVEATGQAATDAAGNRWVEVRGPGVDGEAVQGWVASRYVRPNAEGAMGEAGRINPDLEAQGYRAVTVEEGGNVWEIAREAGADFPGTLRLNDHLIDPSLVFAGDKVYLPGTAAPATAPPAEPAPPEAPTAPPSGSDEASGSGSAPGSTPPTNGTASGTEPQPTPGPSPTPGSGSSSGAPTAADRPSLEAVLRDYQVKEEELVPWTPDYQVGGISLPAPLRDIAEDRAEELNGGPIEPKNLPRTEAALLDRLDVFELRDVSRIMTQSFDAADRNFPWSGQVDKFKGQNDGHNDAFRHAYWNAQLTRRFGADFAERYATAHEATPGNPGPREAMDMYNNELGRRIATENPGASDEELQRLIKDAIDRGEAVVIDGGNNLAWSDQVPYLQHGNPPQDAPAQPGVIQPQTGS